MMNDIYKETAASMFQDFLSKHNKANTVIVNFNCVFEKMKKEDSVLLANFLISLETKNVLCYDVKDKVTLRSILRVPNWSWGINIDEVRVTCYLSGNLFKK